MLHRFAKFLVACTVLLILAGSLVTSHDAGLSVPDWPTSYGWNMFTFPPSMWVANILYEHGHRLIASTVGFLTIIMAVWLWMAEPRRWLRWFGVATLGSVVAQGLLGGLTVLFFLPAAISTAHAGLAEIFFCMTVAIAIFTSPGWIAGYGMSPRRAPPRMKRGRSRTSRQPLRDARDDDHASHLRADSRRRDDAAYRRGAGDSGFPADVRPPDPRSLEQRDRDPFHAPRRRAAGDAAILALFAHVRRRHRAIAPSCCGRRRSSLALVAVQVTLGALTVLSRRDPLDQQLPRRLRRDGADHVAGDHAALLARRVLRIVRIADCRTLRRRERSHNRTSAIIRIP